VAAEATWRWAGEALLGQLRATARLLATLETPVAQPAARSATTAGSSRRSPSLVAAAVATLRANVSIRTEAGRHALRLAVIAALAEVIVQATGLYQGRWVTLTIFLVLKPDYGSTLYRGVQRAAGTVLGAGAGLAAAEFAQLTPARLVAAAAACIAVAYALFDVSFLIFSVFLTGFILALLDLLGTPAVATAEARLLDTFIGSGAGTAGLLRMAHVGGYYRAGRNSPSSSRPMVPTQPRCWATWLIQAGSRRRSCAPSNPQRVAREATPRRLQPDCRSSRRGSR